MRNVSSMGKMPIPLTAIVGLFLEDGIRQNVAICALPGCVTQGETMPELRFNLQEAVELWLEAGDPETTENKEDQILEFAV